MKKLLVLFAIAFLFTSCPTPVDTMKSGYFTLKATGLSAYASKSGAVTLQKGSSMSFWTMNFDGSGNINTTSTISLYGGIYTLTVDVDMGGNPGTSESGVDHRYVTTVTINGDTTFTLTSGQLAVIP